MSLAAMPGQGWEQEVWPITRFLGRSGLGPQLWAPGAGLALAGLSWRRRPGRSPPPPPLLAQAAGAGVLGARGRCAFPGPPQTSEAGPGSQGAAEGSIPLQAQAASSILDSELSSKRLHPSPRKI